MKKISVLTIFVLLGFLFLVNALGHSSARGNINILGEKDQNELEVTRRVNSNMFAQKESSSDGINGGHHHVRKLGFREKKAKDEYYSSMVYSSKISGASSTYSDDGISCDDSERSEGVLDEVKNDAFKKSMGTLEEEEEMDDQKMKDDILISNYLATKKPNPPLSSKGVQVIIRKARRLSMSSSTSTRPERSQISQEEEKTQKDIGLEVEEEIVNLIHNDYKGMARRKPPINNHEPRN